MPLLSECVSRGKNSPNARWNEALRFTDRYWAKAGGSSGRKTGDKEVKEDRKKRQMI